MGLGGSTEPSRLHFWPDSRLAGFRQRRDSPTDCAVTGRRKESGGSADADLLRRRSKPAIP